MASAKRRPKNNALSDQIAALEAEQDSLRDDVEQARVDRKWAPAINGGIRLVEFAERLALLKADLRDGRVTEVGNLRSLILETRRLRFECERDRSMTAAEKLLAREADLVLKLRDEEAAALEQKRAHLTGDQIVDELLAAVLSLPPALRAQLRSALDDAAAAGA